MSRPFARRGAPVARFVFSLAAATFGAAAILAARSTTPQQQPAPFRTGVNFVRVDVYPTGADGRHVADLKSADFEILENGVPQTIQTFEHVVIASAGATSAAERVDPDSTRTEKQLAADARNRLFVLFLDSSHVTDPVLFARDDERSGRFPAPTRRDGPPMPVTSALTNFLEKTVGPDDLVALMTPEMDARQIVFVRRPSAIEEFLKTAWARRFAPGRGTPDEQRLLHCGLSPELLARRQEQQSIRAARDLVAHLRSIREERKAVLLVSEGWMLYRPDRTVAPTRPPAPKGIYVGPDGKLRTGVDEGRGEYDPGECGREAVRLSLIDDERDFRDLADEANRANVTFYPVDPRGLAAVDRMAGGQLQGERVPRGKEDPSADGMRDALRRAGFTEEEADALLQRSVVTNIAALKERLETMRTLANATDGLTLLSNDLDRVLQRIADDLSAYYLLGYSSTNAKADGSFRRITVRVSRSGVTVRARRGYKAATAEELKASRTAPAREDPAAEPARHALAGIPALHDGVPFVAEAGRGCAVSGPDAPVRRGIWLAGEITASGARDTDWKSGAIVEISIADAAGHAVGGQRTMLAPAEHRFGVTIPMAVGSGEMTIAIVARPAVTSALPVKNMLRLPADPTWGDGPMCVGNPALVRWSPFTGNRFQPTADPRFRRQDRVRVEVPVSGAVDAFGATLLDGAGQPIPVPMTPSDRRDESGWRWIGGELALAPLAAGDYVVQIEVTSGAMRQKVLRAFRIVP